MHGGTRVRSAVLAGVVLLALAGPADVVAAGSAEAGGEVGATSAADVRSGDVGEVVRWVRNTGPDRTADASGSTSGTFERTSNGPGRYFDVCGDMDGSRLDLRKTVIERPDTSTFRFNASSCEAWGASDLGDGEFIWWVVVPGGRGDGPDYVVVAFREGGSYEIAVVHTPSDDPATWTETHRGPAERSTDSLAIRGEVPVSALDGHDLFAFALDAVDAEGRWDHLPELHEDLLFFPNPCGQIGATRSTVTAEPGELRAAVAAAGRAGLQVTAVVEGSGVFEVRAPVARARVLEALAGVSDVRAAVTFERFEVIPDDPLYSEQWGLPAIRAPQAWTQRTGSGLKLAVVDDGIDATRAEFAGRVLEGRDTLYGGVLRAGESSDRGGHGTAVAGVAVAQGDDGVGIAGVDWTAQIIPYRMYDAAGCGSTVAAAAAIEHAVGEGASVINISGGVFLDDHVLLDAVRDAHDAGVVIVAAGGNTGTDGLAYPARYPETIAVGATDRDDERTSYSSTGSELDLVAPGGASPDHGVGVLTLGELGTYEPAAGTSFSAPHASGAVLLFLARHPQASPEQVRRALAETAWDLGPVGHDEEHGHGLLDAGAFVRLSTPPNTDERIDRMDGFIREKTAVWVSRRSFPDPDEVDTIVLARSDAYPDALAGAPLAYEVGGPVLLTRPDRLDPVVAREVRRLAPSSAVLLGGTGALHEEVEEELAVLGVSEISRCGSVCGADRFETAVRIGDAVVGQTGETHAYLVRGAAADPRHGWPDAVAVSGLAAMEGRPVLLTDRDELPDATRDGLQALGITHVTIVGGEAAVSAEVAEAVAAAGVDVDRPYAGSDRYDTSRLVAEAMAAAGASPGRVWLATGRNFPDALAAGAATAADGGVLLLADGQDLAGSPTVRDWLDTHPAERVSLVGGGAAITREVEDDVAARLP